MGSDLFGAARFRRSRSESCGLVNEAKEKSASCSGSCRLGDMGERPDSLLLDGLANADDFIVLPVPDKGIAWLPGVLVAVEIFCCGVDLVGLKKVLEAGELTEEDFPGEC